MSTSPKSSNQQELVMEKKERVDSLELEQVSQQKGAEEKTELSLTQGSSDFEKADRLKVLKEKILESASFLSWEKRKSSFQDSEWDSRPNFESAKAIVAASYGENFDEPFVAKRVLALYFLRYTKQLGSRDCLHLFDTVVQQFDGESDPKVRHAIQFDLGAVVYACTDAAGSVLKRRVEALPDPSLKGQGLEAVQKYKEDSSKERVGETLL
ncbi:MAG: hypothetical protein KA436_04630 [Oligoflexales bacterium]|nr:hypothetical protein [Oligoflexales bacterium]